MKNPRNENNNTYGGGDENSTKKTKLEESSSFTDQSLVIQQRIDSSSSSRCSSSSASTTEDTETLDPTKYKKWTKEQVAALLCAPDEVGGAGLTEEKVKPLYNANFDGTSIDNIINIIYIDGKDKYFAIEEGCKDFTDVPRTTINSVVFWVDKLLKTRLYHLWKAEHVKEQLCKHVKEGGAGLSQDEILLIPDINGRLLLEIKNNVIQEINAEEQVLKKISNWLSKLTFKVPKVEILLDSSTTIQRDSSALSKLQSDNNFVAACDIVQIETRDLNENNSGWYSEFATLLIDSTKQTTIGSSGTISTRLNDLHNTAFTLMNLGNVPSDLEQDIERLFSLSGSLKEVNKNVLFFKANVHLKPLSEVFEDKTGIFKDVNVPIGTDNVIAKDIFPFIPHLQVDLLDDSQRKQLDEKIKSGNTIAIIAPSGVGKTAMISRRLGVNPGIFFTCSRDTNMKPRGIDPCSISLDDELKKARCRGTLYLYAISRQIVQCNFIARLLYIRMCEALWDYGEPSNNYPFNSVLELLSYAQYNGNNGIAKEIFLTLISNEWHHKPIDQLRKVTIHLILEMQKILKCSDKPFMFAFDEANVFSIESSVILSPNGNPRDVLTLLFTEVSQLKLGLFSNGVTASDIYCGTLFTSDVIDVVQSAIGKRDLMPTIFSHFELDKLSREQFISMLSLMFNIQNDLLNDLTIFPTRRRVIGLACQNLPKMNKEETISSVIQNSWEEFCKDVEEIVTSRLLKLTSYNYLNLLFKIYIRNKYPSFFPSSKIYSSLQVASTVVGTGLVQIADNITGEYSFYCDDPITKYVTNKLLTKQFRSNKLPNENPLTIIAHILNSEIVDTIYWETIFYLILTYFNGKLVSDIPFVQRFSKEDHTFQATKFLNSVEFYGKYCNSSWAKKKLEKFLKENQKEMAGDFLYWYCVCECLEKGPTCELHGIVNGLVFSPTRDCHTDSLLFNSPGNIYAISNKLQKSQRKGFMKELLYGKNSTNYELFYADKFNSNNPSNAPSWWNDFNDVIREKASKKWCSIIAHIHVKPEKLITKTKRKTLNISENLIQTTLDDLKVDAKHCYFFYNDLMEVCKNQKGLKELFEAYFSRIKFNEKV